MKFKFHIWRDMPPDCSLWGFSRPLGLGRGRLKLLLHLEISDFYLLEFSFGYSCGAGFHFGFSENIRNFRRKSSTAEVSLRKLQQIKIWNLQMKRSSRRLRPMPSGIPDCQLHRLRRRWLGLSKVTEIDEVVEIWHFWQEMSNFDNFCQNLTENVRFDKSARIWQPCQIWSTSSNLSAVALNWSYSYQIWRYRPNDRFCRICQICEPADFGL